MISAEQIANGLEKGKKVKDGWEARCPAHDDNNPSLSITDDNGKVLVHCYAGCPQDSVISALESRGLWNKKAPIEADNPSLHEAPDFASVFGKKPSGVYIYRSKAGGVLGYTCRFVKANGDKYFQPVRSVDAKWISKGFDEPTPLYQLDQLTAKPDKPVIIVEGEKAADAAAKLFPDMVATTWLGGANQVNKVDLMPLENRAITIWPDNDPVGIGAAKTLAQNLGGISKETRIVDLPETLPKKWDVADPVPDGVDLHALVNRAKIFDETLASLVLTAKQLALKDIPEREYIIDPFLPSNSLSMIFAKRGVGKTWVALCLAIAVARGDMFLAYDVPEPRLVLMIDGEMTASDLKQRMELLGANDEENIMLLLSEFLFQESRQININKSEDQELIIKTLEKLESQGRRPDLIIVDNLSSLGGGIEENDNSALEAQLMWLVQLRHMGFAVMLVHHAGKSGDQRGASRREDLLDTSIKLELPDKKDEQMDFSGATFTLEFVKTRGERPMPDQLLLSLRQNECGVLEFQFSAKVNAAPRMKTLRTIYNGTISEGGSSRPFKTQQELAEHTKLSKSTISKHLTSLRKSEFCGNLPRNKGIGITDRGMEQLHKVYGEEFNAPEGYEAIIAKHKPEPDSTPDESAIS